MFSRSVTGKPKELAEEFTMVLRADNPEAPHNIVRFSHKEKMFKLDPSVDQLELHFQDELMHELLDVFVMVETINVLVFQNGLGGLKFSC